MPNGIQLSAPATLPTPRQARGNLRACRKEVHETAGVVEGMKDRLDAAKEEQKAALLDIEAAEGDLLDADEDGPQEKAAQTAHHEAFKRAERAAADAEKVKATLKLARGELKMATKRLTAAREDLEAIREGRRKP